jgi:hypothetical protein
VRGGNLRLDLFPALGLSPTPSQLAVGRMTLHQCSQCGLLVSAPDCGPYRADDHLGPCPRCERRGWWSEDLPVGPFRDRQAG